jgi:ribokinase
VCICGSLNADLIVYRSNQRSIGSYDVGDTFELDLRGGKGFNVALSLASLGLETYLVGRLGSDVFGNLMNRKLAKTPVRGDFVQVDPQNATGIGHVRVNTDDGMTPASSPVRTAGWTAQTSMQLCAPTRASRTS